MDSSQKEIGWDGNNGRYYIYIYFKKKEKVIHFVQLISKEYDFDVTMSFRITSILC